jgi:hypothetical protein
MKSVEKLKSFAEKQNGILQQFYSVGKSFKMLFKNLTNNSNNTILFFLKKNKIK